MLWPVIAVFLLLSAVLWAIPRIRRAGSDRAIAWKCVPPGCAVMLLVTELFTLAVWLLAGHGRGASRFLNSGSVFFTVTVAGVIAGILLIVKLRNICRRKYALPESTPANGPYRTVFFLLLFAAPVIYIAGCFAAVAVMVNMPGGYHGPWRTYPVAEENGVELAFQERSIHPFLAEYDYRLRFRKAGKNTYRDLWCNTGGQTHVNVFRLSDGRFVFSDKDEDCLADLKSQRVFVLRRHDGKIYAGLLPEGRFDRPASIVTSGGRPVIHTGRRELVTHVVPELSMDRKNYFGHISYGFFPASEKPYQPIQKRW